jgi:cysteine synthase B
VRDVAARTAEKAPVAEIVPAMMAALEARAHNATRAGSVLDLIGNTPLVRLRNVTRHLRRVQVYAKLESFNPGGSVKDRAARQMVLDGIAAGHLTRDKTLIDSSSGNTAVAYAMIGAAMGYRVSLVMPSNVTKQRKDITTAYGASHVFSDPLEGSDGAIRLMRQIVAADPEKYFYPDQYSNESNPRAHYLTTGPEIFDALGERLTHFVAGLGTSGTVMGTGRFLKERVAGVRIVAAQPSDALHGIEGWKHMPSSLIPKIWRPDECVDEIIGVETESSLDLAERLATEEGLFVGHSCGASCLAALRIAEELEREGRSGVIVTIFPDGGARYLPPIRWERYTEW